MHQDQNPSNRLHCTILDTMKGTFSIRQMIVAILKRCHIPISNKKPIEAAVDDHIESEMFSE